MIFKAWILILTMCEIWLVGRGVPQGAYAVP